MRFYAFQIQEFNRLLPHSYCMKTQKGMLLAKEQPFLILALSCSITAVGMKKLGEQYQFVDLSDYGRPLSDLIAKALQNTKVTAIHLTLLFGFVGTIAFYAILGGHHKTVLLLLILKSIIDGADGALARLKNQPSFTGRYLDSVFDILLNLLLLGGVWYVSDMHWLWWIGAFFSIQLQGTLYNYYYVILRNRISGGDNTSKVFEYRVPKALPGESQTSVNVMYYSYKICYSLFDRVVHALDPQAYQEALPQRWLMTLVSIYGLGFQLLLLGLALIWLPYQWILPGIVALNVFLPLFILLRKFTPTFGSNPK